MTTIENKPVTVNREEFVEGVNQIMAQLFKYDNLPEKIKLVNSSPSVMMQGTKDGTEITVSLTVVLNKAE